MAFAVCFQLIASKFVIVKAVKFHSLIVYLKK